MDRVEAMNILVSVVETGSFTAAGKRLGVPLPTVSRKLADLESHLGTRLLARSTRRLDLTEAGKDYVAACKRILEDISNAERKASGEFVTPKGELLVTAPVIFGRLHVVPIVAAFLAAYTEIDVRLVLSDRNAQLLDDHIDLAVRIGALPDSSMISVQVGSVRQVVCASPEFLVAHGIPKKPADLSGLSCVTFVGEYSGSGSRCRNCRRWCDADSILSSRESRRGGKASACARRVRARSSPRQSHAYGAGSSSPQNAQLHRLCCSAPAGRPDAQHEVGCCKAGRKRC
jgi:DNA-binding transcriptional LysR family regulator